MISSTSATTADKIQQLDQVCVIHSDFDIWSGQTRLDPKDLKLGIGGEIPPEKLALLGSKKICDPARLKGFSRLKTKARRVLAHYGLPFMNGWAVPAERLDTIMKQLDQIKVEFEQVRTTFLTQYDTAVEAWIADNPGYEDIIRAGAMPRSVVEKRIGFDYAVYHIRPAGNDASQQQLGRQVDQLGNNLFAEIIKEANTFYEEKLRGASELLTSTRPTLQKLYDKVDGLSFLNAAFDPLAKLLQETIQGYSTHAVGGRIVAPYLYQVVAAVLICCDRQKIDGYALGTVTMPDMANSIPADSTATASAAPETVAAGDQNSAPDAAGVPQELSETAAPDTEVQVAVPAEPELPVAAATSPASQNTETPEAEAIAPAGSNAPESSSPEALFASMDAFFADFDSSSQASPSEAVLEEIESREMPSPAAAEIPAEEPAPATDFATEAGPTPEPVPVPELSDDDDWSW